MKRSLKENEQATHGKDSQPRRATGMLAMEADYKHMRLDNKVCVIQHSPSSSLTAPPEVRSCEKHFWLLKLLFFFFSFWYHFSELGQIRNCSCGFGTSGTAVRELLPSAPCRSQRFVISHLQHSTRLAAEVSAPQLAQTTGYGGKLL